MAGDGGDADDRENADPSRGLAVDAPPPPPDIKEKLNLYSDSPASPQSSLPILGENKEPDSNGIHSNSASISGNGEESDSNAKKRNVFRPSVFDRQAGRHDRWRSDDMEPNSGIVCSVTVIRKSVGEVTILRRETMTNDMTISGILAGVPPVKDNNLVKDTERDSNISRSWNASYLTSHGTRGPGDASLTEPVEQSYTAPQKSQSIGDHIHGSTAKFMQQNNASDQGTKIDEIVDPQGQIQGPFSGSDIIDWFEAGYFGIDLLVSVSSAPPDAPLQLLGDVMPHLREKARPPPGFSTLKPSSVPEPSTLGSAYLGISDYSSINKSDRATEVESHFLESPMSSNIQNPRAETSIATGGMNEWSSNTSENNFVCGNENVNGINYHGAQKAVLERENPFQTERDVISATQAQKDTVQCSSHAKWFPQMVVSSSETLLSQNDDLLPVLFSAEKHQPPAVNSGLQLWADDFESGSVGLTEGLIGIGVQQHHSLAQNQPTLACLNSQTTDPEKFLSEMSQDPPLLNIQQQYLLQPSLQPQKSRMPQPQPSLFSNMLPLRQQEQHLSQVLPDDQLAQPLHYPSYEPTDVSVSSGVTPKSLLEIQAEEQLKAQMELENAVTVAPASVSSIPWSSIVKGSEQLFGDVTKSMGDLKNVNTSSSTRSQSHDLLTEKTLVKSNDRDAATVVVNDASFPLPVPYITQSSAHSHDDSGFVEVNNSRKKRNKAEKSRGSRAKPPTFGPSKPSVISVPVKKDGKQVQQGRDASQREAMDFREWCDNEWTKLTGTNDTSFLEFCIKQPASEAEMLLVDNIGSLDHNRNFIDKFLSYKAFLKIEQMLYAWRKRQAITGVYADCSPSNHGVVGIGRHHLGANAHATRRALVALGA
ncbi:hypothetical protein PR202_ga13665 [Eleusine coracana subsp. coracana]|uniref:GYF domain-containing protein n=1 Tax=Eleusine coracana subsp. coracana TaxID=191504 RepID=A0AAV5CEV6_ELECO|nr:hypothetical protein PR202_ga13665 [Eleusine coracana subsp. coracana]